MQYLAVTDFPYVHEVDPDTFAVKAKYGLSMMEGISMSSSAHWRREVDKDSSLQFHMIYNPITMKADFALYKSLMIGCCKNNQMEMALKVYENMRLLGIKPTDVYRLEKKGGSKRGSKPSVSFEFEKSFEEQRSEEDYLHDFHRICNLYRGPRTRESYLF